MLVVLARPMIVAVPTLARLRRWLAILRLITRGELGLQLRMANKALRIGPLVLLAPIALLLKLGRQFRIAQAALFFRHAVLAAPPAIMRMARGRLCRRRHRRRLRTANQ